MKEDESSILVERGLDREETNHPKLIAGARGAERVRSSVARVVRAITDLPFLMGPDRAKPPHDR
ncbi:MAG: hypothetical protein FJ257_06420 [Phycisphaerae bacterium]|nr:hypothetical protein [Phycisphaerae bacterium]